MSKWDDDMPGFFEAYGEQILRYILAAAVLAAAGYYLVPSSFWSWVAR
jgi:hypothetical protein